MALLEHAATFLLKQIVCLYRRYISPYFAPSCRYYPTCSQYALVCLDKYSFRKSFIKIVLRILKCNPFFPGGEDLP